MKIFTTDSRIKEAVQWAQNYFDSHDFILDIKSVSKFQNSNVSPSQIAELFHDFGDNRVEVKLSYFGIFHKKVLGRTIGNGFAYVNTSGLGRQVWQIAATIVHEVSHVVDEFYPQARFGHGSNSAKGKGMTFPYFIDDKAENWIKKEVLKKEINRLAIQQVVLREVIHV